MQMIKNATRIYLESLMRYLEEDPTIEHNYNQSISLIEIRNYGPNNSNNYAIDDSICLYLQKSLQDALESLGINDVTVVYSFYCDENQPSPALVTAITFPFDDPLEKPSKFLVNLHQERMNYIDVSIVYDTIQKIYLAYHQLGD